MPNTNHITLYRNVPIDQGWFMNKSDYCRQIIKYSAFAYLTQSSVNIVITLTVAPACPRLHSRLAYDNFENQKSLCNISYLPGMSPKLI